MRHQTLYATVIVAVLLRVSAVHADSAAPQPANSSGPQPSCDVYLTPFTPLVSDNSLDWVGKAVQQNLLTDLARANYHPLGSDKPIATTADAQAAAKAAGAKFLISGTYQVADQQVRFTGQLIDAGNGNVLGGISTTGAMRDLFKMEDALSSQAVQQLGQHAAAPAVARNPPGKPAAQAPAAPAAPPANPPVVVQIVQPPAPGGVAAAPTRYQGSALEQYVNANRTPSSDYNTSSSGLDNSAGDNFASTPGQNYNVGFTSGFGYGYGFAYGYGLSFGYPLPPYGRYGYGTDGRMHHHSDLVEH